MLELLRHRLFISPCLNNPIVHPDACSTFQFAAIWAVQGPPVNGFEAFQILEFISSSCEVASKPPLAKPSSYFHKTGRWYQPLPWSLAAIILQKWSSSNGRPVCIQADLAGLPVTDHHWKNLASRPASPLPCSPSRPRLSVHVVSWWKPSDLSVVN